MNVIKIKEHTMQLKHFLEKSEKSMMLIRDLFAK
jgi:hypothetical protein